MNIIGFSISSTEQGEVTILVSWDSEDSNQNVIVEYAKAENLHLLRYQIQEIQ